MLSGLIQAVREAAALHLDKPATIFADRERSWREVLERAGRIAGGLAARGARPGDRVAVWAANSDFYIELYFAIAMAGGVITPLNSRWSPAEIAFALADAESRVLFVDVALAPQLAQMGDSLAGVEVVAMDGTCADWTRYDDLFTDRTLDVEAGGGDLWSLFYTGGTTGTPKAVMLTHDAVLWNANACREHSLFPPRTRFLHVAPMFHMASAAAVIGVSLSAGAHIVMPSFEPAQVLETLDRRAVRETLLVPTMIQLLVDHPSFASHDLRDLRTILYGASPITPSVLDRAQAALPGVAFMQAYGMTELAPVATVLGALDHAPEPRGAARRASAGRPLRGVTLRVVGGDGRDLALGEVGEVWVRSPGVMRGYWRRPGETEVALKDGWLRTGDAGRIDLDGYLFIVDRVKDMIISGGENVYSAEVENALASHPDVAQCAVIGVPDARWGEAVAAVVVRRPGATAGTDELIAHCRARIAAYKCPREVIFRDDPLPLSAAGKVLKRELRASMKAL